jgi:diacylglycerol kinase (ATP)
MPSRLPRLTLIHNESAGGSSHGPQSLIDLIAGAGYSVSYFSGEKSAILGALDKPTDLIVAAGGDGTVRRVAIQARADGPPIAILPLGTANNIAKSLGIVRSVEKLVAGWKDGRLRPFHLIGAAGPWGKQRIVEGIGFGALAEAIDQIDGKPPPGRARQWLGEMMPRAEPEFLNVQADENSFSAHYILFEITTIPLVGPNLRLAPQADPSDRIVEICFAGDSPTERQRLSEWLLDKPEEPAPVSFRRATRLSIAGQFRRVRLDDKAWVNQPVGSATIILGVEAEPLHFLVPGQAE